MAGELNATKREKSDSHGTSVFIVEGKPTTIPLDLVNGSSPLIIGFDIKNWRHKEYG